MYSSATGRRDAGTGSSMDWRNGAVCWPGPGLSAPGSGSTNPGKPVCWSACRNRVRGQFGSDGSCGVRTCFRPPCAIRPKAVPQHLSSASPSCACCRAAPIFRPGHALCQAARRRDRTVFTPRCAAGRTQARQGHREAANPWQAAGWPRCRQGGGVRNAPRRRARGQRRRQRADHR